jgi:hypothetical protein
MFRKDQSRVEHDANKRQMAVEVLRQAPPGVEFTLSQQVMGRLKGTLSQCKQFA